VKSWQTSLVTNCIQGEIQKTTVISELEAILSVYWCNFRISLGKLILLHLNRDLTLGFRYAGDK